MPVDNKNPQQQKKVAPITINGIPQAVIDMVRDKHPDYDNVMGLGNQTMQGAPSGQIPAVAPQPMNMNVFQQNGGVTGKLEAPVVQTQQAQPAASSVQTPYLGDAAEKTQQPPTGWKADGTPSYDALSSALSGYQTAQSKQVPEFQADPSQRDGGFFGWLGKLIPKSRPGMREGETPDEYDRRITTNRERIAAFADAIRHMGNIVNTSKGAPLQVFNDPTSMLEQGYQTRKAQRQKQDAIDADAAYKQANLSLKQRAAEVAEAYKQATLGYKQAELQQKADKDKTDLAKWKAKFEFDAAKDNRDFEYKKIRDKIKDGQWQAGYGIKIANLNLSRARFAHTVAKDARGRGKAVGYATPYGSLYSNKELTRNQENQLWDFMIRNKQITPAKIREYQAALNDAETEVNGKIIKGSSSKARGIIQKAIAYGFMDATPKGDRLRKFCTTQLGMGEDRVYKTPQNATTWVKGSVKQGKTGNWSI